MKENICCCALFFAALVMAQSTATKQPPKATAKKVAVSESPEHAFARMNLEKNQQREEFIKKITACVKLVNERKSSGRAPTAEQLQTCSYDLNGAAFADAVRTFCDSFQGNPTCDTHKLAVDLASADLTLFEQNIIAKGALEIVDECARLYRATIDKKVSDLTTRQTDRIPVCKENDLYPPKSK